MARDGIEPPTPAFSGPRSTTELSGLRANFDQYINSAAPARRKRPVQKQSPQQREQYINRICKAISWSTLAGFSGGCSTLKGIMRHPCLPRRLLVLAAATASPPGPAAYAGARAAHAYQAAIQAGSAALHAFLAEFPKGADLHVHLSGAVYAETFIRDAGEDGLCVDPAALSFAKPPCAPPLVPAAQLSANQPLYDRLVDAFSMRSFVPTPGFSGHDQFFATFDRFGGLSKSHIGEWVDEVATRAAAAEPAVSRADGDARLHPRRRPRPRKPTQPGSCPISPKVARPWPARRGCCRPRSRPRRRGPAPPDRALRHAAGRARLQVEVRFIYQILRGFLPEQVFAQTLLGFETIQATIDAHEPGFVGINFVMPEDGFVSMRDYTLQMKMLDYLHSVYPQVPISLHAGELAPGLVPPEGLRFHIRQAVELGHAERIGHGVDVMYEDDAPGLLKEMAAKHVMVEINLSSNEGILGVKGAQHPFTLYRAAHVPVALSTDDEGVSRIDITNEYVRAALDYQLSYKDLKHWPAPAWSTAFFPAPASGPLRTHSPLPPVPAKPNCSAQICQ